MKITVIIETKLCARKIAKTATVELPDIDSFTLIDPQAAENVEQTKIRKTIETLMKELNKK